MSVVQQRTLVVQGDGGHSVQARCQALGLSRSSFYYQPCGESAYNLHLMRLLDEEFTAHNFKGVLGLRDHLRLDGHAVKAKRVRRLVRLMGHEPVYLKPRLSIPGQGVRPTRICCETARPPPRMRSGARTSPTCPWPRAFSTWPRFWTGTRATC
jgi:putative transposase